MNVIYIDREQRKRERPFTDLSVWSLIISNLLVGIWAVIAGWSLAWMLWIYWLQSISIGIFWMIRIGESGGASRNPRAKMTTNRLDPVAGFILVYAGFHFVLGCVLWFHFLEQKPTIGAFCAGGIFFLNGLFSFIRNRVPEHKKRSLIDSVDFPMLRVFPIHLTICLALALRDFAGIEFGGAITVFIFILLKTIVDLGMYLREQELFYQPRKFRI